MIRCLLVSLFLAGCAVAAAAAPAVFRIPSQQVSSAVRAFSEQSKLDVLFSEADVASETSRPLDGAYEPLDALNRMLEGTLVEPKTGPRGTLIIKRRLKPTGALVGQILQPDGTPAASYRVFIQHSSQLCFTDANGNFTLNDITPGYVRLRLETGSGRDPVSQPYRVDPGQLNRLEPWVVSTEAGAIELAPMEVQGETNRALTYSAEALQLRPRTAVGNLDLPRFEDGPLNYTLFRRDAIARSGVVNLNEYLRREMLDADGVSNAPVTNGIAGFLASSNLSLRGFQADETVILINGRRLPEVVTSGAAPLPPDVNFVPLSMVEQVEVLPTSASALYMGNPVGGVVNVVLRPEQEGPTTEVSATYGNTTGGFDAPNTSFSVLHARSLAGGKMRVRIHGNTTQVTPATEAELGHHAKLSDQPADTNQANYRATPEIRTTDGSSLLPGGGASFGSIKPGAPAGAGIQAVLPGVLNPNEFETPVGPSPAIQSRNYLYGAEEKSYSWMGAVVWDPTTWLQLGVDAFWSQRTLKRGTDIVAGDLLWHATSPANPFGKDVLVSVLEALPKLGRDYNAARVNYGTVVFGALLKPRRNVRVSFDAQYSRNTTELRSLAAAGYDVGKWEQLLNAGQYNPLRDTQLSGPGDAFMNQVLIYREAPGRFVKIGDFSVLDAAIRGVVTELPAPGGEMLVQGGFDYRSSTLADHSEQPRFGDGSNAGEPFVYKGRTLPRYSAFTELQAPLLPKPWQTRWLRQIETDLAVRYVAADTAKERNVSPTLAMKADFAYGLSVRGSLTYASRYPTPQMSRQLATLQPDSGTGVEFASIKDPLRRGEAYPTRVLSAVDPNLRPEKTVTQSAGVLWQTGAPGARWRFSVDFVDTRKNDEHTFLDGNALMNLESFFPNRVIRALPTAGDNGLPGRVTSLITGTTNVATRESQNWNIAVSHRREGIFGGAVDTYVRWLYFQNYTRVLFPNEPEVNELDDPDGTAPGLLRHRGKMGVSWSRRETTFGFDWRYYHKRVLPKKEWATQGGRTVGAHQEMDIFVQQGLRAWFPSLARWNPSVQLRVNNVLNNSFPRYANDQANTGVQAYGDWRGRTFSLTVRSEF